MRIKYAGRLLASVVTCAMLAGPAYAQYSGPSSIGENTVAAILENPVDDQDVQLQGYLLRKTAHDKYVFSDGTGEIIAEIKDKRFPSQPVSEKTKVEIKGEVDTGFSRPPEIEVDSVLVLD